VSSKGIEVDKAKVDLIVNLPPPKTVREVRAFLGHTGALSRTSAKLLALSVIS